MFKMSTEYIKETDKSTFCDLGFMSKNIVWMLMSLEYCIYKVYKAKTTKQSNKTQKEAKEK